MAQLPAAEQVRIAAAKYHAQVTHRIERLDRVLDQSRSRDALAARREAYAFLDRICEIVRYCDDLDADLSTPAKRSNAADGIDFWQGQLRRESTERLRFLDDTLSILEWDD